MDTTSPIGVCNKNNLAHFFVVAVAAGEVATFAATEPSLRTPIIHYGRTVASQSFSRLSLTHPIWFPHIRTDAGGETTDEASQCVGMCTSLNSIRNGVLNRCMLSKGFLFVTFHHRERRDLKVTRRMSHADTSSNPSAALFRSSAPRPNGTKTRLH